MFFHAGARAALRFPAPFRPWPREGFGLQSKETPAFSGMSGAIREISPQLLFFRRPGGFNPARRARKAHEPGGNQSAPPFGHFAVGFVSPLSCHWVCDKEREKNGR